MPVIATVAEIKVNYPKQPPEYTTGTTTYVESVPSPYYNDGRDVPVYTYETNIVPTP